MPPVLIFLRKKKPKNMNMLRNAPPGSKDGYNISGWIEKDIFTRWFAEFIKFPYPSESRPVILILDGHALHIRNLDVINMARENHVSIVCLPLHATHRMQPLARSFMKLFKTFYSQEIETYNKEHQHILTMRDIGKIFVWERIFKGCFINSRCK